MSDHPPPPPPPPPFSYVGVAPVPVMPCAMFPQPAASTHPTYITNHYYPPEAEAEPVQVVDEPESELMNDIDWIQATPYDADALTQIAVVAGHEPGGISPLWVIKASYNGDLLPGKLSVKERKAYVPYHRKEISVDKFQVLCGPKRNLEWVGSSHGEVPETAISGGFTAEGETLYIGRVPHKGSLTPGKIHPSHRCCYISFGCAEIKSKHYEVLCWKSDYDVMSR